VLKSCIVLTIIFISSVMSNPIVAEISTDQSSWPGKTLVITDERGCSGNCGVFVNSSSRLGGSIHNDSSRVFDRKSCLKLYPQKEQRV